MPTSGVLDRSELEFTPSYTSPKMLSYKIYIFSSQAAGYLAQGQEGSEEA
jgi:hypothetical protein